VVIQVPYWLPLALFCGIVSQFVPTVGTYIGGALPVIFAWSSNGILYAVGVVVFIIIYQQIENLILSPKISQRTMDLNPAIAFLSVLVLGAMFGALGAFLALPITASIQAIVKVYTKRYELVDSPLMSDPQPVRKSKVVEGAEAFSEHVIRPVSDRMPRAARGTSARVPMNDELRKLQEELYRASGDEDSRGSEDSATVAIPKRVLAKNAQATGLRGTRADVGNEVDAASDESETGARLRSDADASGADDSGAAGVGSELGSDSAADAADSSNDDNADDNNDNPRSRWH
jgi:hypothetical protein